MPTNKKPRKKRRERAENVPMMTPNRDDLAMRLHVAVETLIAAPSKGSCNNVSKKVAVLAAAIEYQCRTISRDKTQYKIDAINAAAATLNSIVDRFNRVGKVGVSDSEAATLRASAGVLDVALGTTPANVFKAAALDVARFDRMSEGN